MEAAKNSDVRKINRDLVIEAMYRSGEMTKADIAAKTKLSFPTVTAVTNELQEVGLIEKLGLMKSEGGRRPVLLQLNRRAYYSVGIGVTEHHVMSVLLDLEGYVVLRRKEITTFEDSKEYWMRIVNTICDLLSEADIAKEKILGVGISITGMFKRNNQTIMLPPKMWEHTIDISEVRNFFPWHVRFYNDAQMMAIKETWSHPEMDSATCLLVGRGLGGALVKNHRLVVGMNFDRIGHMVIKSGVRRCTCGKKGCFEAYCSGDAIEKATGLSLAKFFEKLDQKDPRCEAFWMDYLKYFAIGISNIRLLTNTDVMVFGRLSDYIARYQDQVDQEIEKCRAFEAPDSNFLHFYGNDRYGSAIGAGLIQISRHLPENIPNCVGDQSVQHTALFLDG